MTASRTRGVVLGLLSLPVLLAMGEAATYHVVNRSSGTLVSAGVEREYLLHVPPAYDRTRPAPLVISMHGAGGWPAAQKDTSRWNELADREGVIVVYPSGISGQGPRIWEAEDARFIADLIAHLEASYNIDRRRIYANGLSNGGGMSFALSCTMSDRIAAVGLVAAAQTLPWGWCTDRRAVPMIGFHGTDDAVTPYHGGRTFIGPVAFPDQPAWAANWARRNRCGAEPEATDVAPDVSRRLYANCANNASVVFYTIKGGGHTWPGGGHLPEWLLGRTTHTIDATRVMWEFFRDHPLQ